MVGGLLVSQVLTLYFTPVFYLYLHRLTRRPASNLIAEQVAAHAGTVGPAGTIGPAGTVGPCAPDQGARRCSADLAGAQPRPQGRLTEMDGD